MVNDREVQPMISAEVTKDRFLTHPSSAVAAEVIGLSKVFVTANGDICALAGVTLSVADGEILAIVGPSGAGKTTLLELLAGFDSPTDGEVRIGGLPLRGLNRTCTLMPQGDSLFPWMSVRNNIRYGEGADEAAVDEYLRVVGLEEFAARWPRELSAGMRKRAEVARAYASKADLLLLDEPFGALDVLTKETMHLFLQQVWLNDQRTVIFVTHDVEEALFIAHRVVILSPRPGRIRDVISVPFSFPRPLHLKLTPEFVELRANLLDLLRGPREF
jgi:ABC-type nitrate/sulfonate/bicarbonate transport system ATPase subunit